MEYKLHKLGSLLLLTSLILFGCNKFETRGFLLSYESADERFAQSMEWNETHPYKTIEVAVDNYSLFAMGDSHLGSAENLNTFFADAIDTDGSAAILVGDLSSGHVEDMENIHRLIPEYSVLPSFSLVGNHDLYFDGWKTFHKLWGTSAYWFSVETPADSDLFICLDTGSGTLGSKQLAWLKNILLYKRPDYRRCIIFTHNNLFRIRHTTSTNPMIEEIRMLSELSAEHQVDMIVTGHDHVRNTAVLGNTTHITMDALLDQNDNASYFKLTVGAGEIEYEFVNL